MATDSSILAWRIPGMEEPGGLPSMGSHRVGHDWCNLAAAAADLMGVSQMALVVKNLPANEGDVRDAGPIPGLGRFPRVGDGYPLQYSCWRIPWTEEPCGLQSIESQCIRQHWSHLACTQPSWGVEFQSFTCRMTICHEARGGLDWYTWQLLGSFLFLSAQSHRPQPHRVRGPVGEAKGEVNYSQSNWLFVLTPWLSPRHTLVVPFQAPPCCLILSFFEFLKFIYLYFYFWATLCGMWD